MATESLDAAASSAAEIDDPLAAQAHAKSMHISESSSSYTIESGVN